MKKNGFSAQEVQLEHCLQLMDIYFQELSHRDTLFFEQIFRYFYATLIVLFVPNLSAFLGIILPTFPSVLFPIVSFIMSLTFLYISIGYTKRLEASGKTYQNLIKKLPPDFQRISLSNPKIKWGKFFSVRMTLILSVVMFLSLAIMSVVMIIYHLTAV